MTNTPTPAPKPAKAKRRDAYIARATITIPIDTLNAESLASAIKAVRAIETTLPAGSSVELSATLGKV